MYYVSTLTCFFLTFLRDSDDYFDTLIRVPKVPFHVFDKLKNEIQKFMIRFCFYLDMKHKIQINNYYFHVKIDFYFEFLMLSFVFHFHKKWKTKYSLLFALHFYEGLEKRIT